MLGNVSGIGRTPAFKALVIPKDDSDQYERNF